MAENHVYFCFLEDLSEEEKNLPLHKISVIDEGEQRPVSTRHPSCFQDYKLLSFEKSTTRLIAGCFVCIFHLGNFEDRV